VEWRSARRRQHGSWLCAREGRWFPCRITKWPLARRAPTSGAESAVDAGFRSRHHSLPRLLFVPRSRILCAVLCVPLWRVCLCAMDQGMETDKLRECERGARKRCKAASRRNARDGVAIYGRWRYTGDGDIPTRVPKLSRGPNLEPAELHPTASPHHYHHDMHSMMMRDVVRTAPPCLHVFFHGVWNVMHAIWAVG
jgi:hypothetical protein